jgi:hypothetical protein
VIQITHTQVGRLATSKDVGKTYVQQLIFLEHYGQHGAFGFIDSVVVPPLCEMAIANRQLSLVPDALRNIRHNGKSDILLPASLATGIYLGQFKPADGSEMKEVRLVYQP